MSSTSSTLPGRPPASRAPSIPALHQSSCQFTDPPEPPEPREILNSRLHRSRGRREDLWGELTEPGHGQPEDAIISWRIHRAERQRAEQQHAALARRLDELERQEARARAEATVAEVRARAAAAAEARAHGELEVAAPLPPVGPPRGSRSLGRNARRRGGPPGAPSTSGQRSNSRRMRWAVPSFTGAMAELFGFPTALGFSYRDEIPDTYGSMAGELAAMHQAVMGARSGALPPSLLFSDRDFTDEDYEALLELDKGIENRQGATREAINTIPVERVPRGAGAVALGDCPICLETFRGGESLRRLACKHCYHKGCIDKWLRNKATCPICKEKAA